MVTFLGGEGSACVQSAMSVMLSLMSSALQWLVTKVIHTYTVQIIQMYCIVVKTPPLRKGLNIMIIIIIIRGVFPGSGGYARGILINFGLDYEKICIYIYILHDVLYVHLYVYMLILSFSVRL